MRRPITFVIAFVLIVSALAAGNVSAQGDTRSYYDPFGRIKFSYSTQIAQDTVWQFVPATTDPNVPTGLVPEYIQIDFQNPIEGQGWFNTGQTITVYPVVTFPTDPNQPYAQALAHLRNVLAVRPAVPEGNLPMLPVVTAAPYFRAQFQYVDFAGGSGIRYVTAAGLDVSPLSNQSVFYSFQGLTNDGMYYIAAMIPVKTPVLPDTLEPMTAEQYNQFAATFETYLATITAQLDGLAPQSFVPDLSLLDAALTTFEIDAPDALFITPVGIASVPVAYNNVAFSYDVAFASRVEVDEIAAYVDPGGMSMYGSQPPRTEFTLMGYPVSREFVRPQIFVFPVDSFPAADTPYGGTLEEVKAFLASGAPLTTRLASAGQEPIPMLPLVNAAQIMAAQPRVIDFQNGRGVRFVTTYAQAPYPVTNLRLLYQFIGLTADGRTIVSAQFPITASVLPDDIDHDTFDFDAFMATFNDTMSQTLASLDGLDAAGYTPDLSRLDALMQSIRVG